MDVSCPSMATSDYHPQFSLFFFFLNFDITINPAFIILSEFTLRKKPFLHITHVLLIKLILLPRHRSTARKDLGQPMTSSRTPYTPPAIRTGFQRLTHSTSQDNPNQFWELCWLGLYILTSPPTLADTMPQKEQSSMIYGYQKDDQLHQRPKVLAEQENRANSKEIKLKDAGMIWVLNQAVPEARSPQYLRDNDLLVRSYSSLVAGAVRVLWG